MQKDNFILNLEKFSNVQLPVVSYLSKWKSNFSYDFVVSYEFLKNVIYSWAEVTKTIVFPVESYC